ncbi:MAG: hypothetical protein MZU91_01110 [Desulfosudis oleivorans]|nr:hypothetical protein [Desulfosudis oleivorans]
MFAAEHRAARARCAAMAVPPARLEAVAALRERHCRRSTTTTSASTRSTCGSWRPRRTPRDGCDARARTTMRAARHADLRGAGACRMRRGSTTSTWASILRLRPAAITAPRSNARAPSARAGMPPRRPALAALVAATACRCVPRALLPRWAARSRPARERTRGADRALARLAETGRASGASAWWCATTSSAIGANAMVVWDVPDDAGATRSAAAWPASDFVTLCYRRPRRAAGLAATTCTA